ncbi:homing endonuclease associated repeat-containing protein [Listeria booriae]|uniref:Uncharacterized protein n=1 Tax=Listeria booriae TaxID=1552123 RepID=A0A7X1BW87_9LIST|nr:hypothetical protein [Listeria booriae]MBC1318507.1 hypothetical protein [Listeria booriae]MBC1333521.1 hypothetical protein [Listeria booriae]MBC2388816.1 hypothetical protein [Listeria booriae]
MKKYSNEYLIEEIQLLAKKIGHTPRTTDFSHYSLVFKRFGSWKAFIEAAGLPEYSARKTKTKTIYSRYELAKAAQEQALVLRRAPNSKEFKYAHIVYEFFSNWDEFIKFTGLKPKERFFKDKKVYTSEELVAEVRVVEADLGRIPKCHEVPYGIYIAVRKQYGGWKSFLFKEGFSEKKPTINNGVYK